MKEDRGGAREVCRSALPPAGSLSSPVDVVKWRPRELPASSMARDTKRAWNTRALGWRVGVDVVAASCAGVLVAPIITVIDRGIIENASGRATLSSSITKSLKTLLLRPQHFFFSKPFALIFTLYMGTYLTANTIDTVSSTLRNTPATSTTHGTAKFAATSAANLSLCLWKDTHFTRLFSTAIPRPLPPASYALFTLRDCFTIFASFNIPPIVAPHIPMQLLPNGLSHFKAQNIAQFVAPAAMQILSTPMHLLGLDFYNRTGVTFGERWAVVRKAWAMSCVARMGRIVPAFGVGGVVNTGLRGRLMAGLE